MSSPTHLGSSVEFVLLVPPSTRHQAVAVPPQPLSTVYVNHCRLPTSSSTATAAVAATDASDTATAAALAADAAVAVAIAVSAAGWWVGACIEKADASGAAQVLAAGACSNSSSSMM